MALDAVNQGQVIDGSSATVASAKAVGDVNVANITTTQPKTFDYNAPKKEDFAKRLDDLINGRDPEVANNSTDPLNHGNVVAMDLRLQVQAQVFADANRNPISIFVGKQPPAEFSQALASTGGLKFKSPKEELQELKEEYQSPWSGEPDSNISAMA